MDSDKPERNKRFFLSFILLSVGSILLYLSISIIVQGNHKDLLELFYSIAFGIFSLFLLLLGIIGLFLRIRREIIISENGISIQNQWIHKKIKIFVPINSILIIFSNLNNNFPGLFLVWKEGNSKDIIVNYIEKDEIANYKYAINTLSIKVSVNHDTYCNASILKKYALEKYNAKSLKWL